MDTTPAACWYMVLFVLLCALFLCWKICRVNKNHVHLTHIHISTAHLNTSLSEDVFGPEDTRSQNAERYTNYHENWTSVLGPDVSERVLIPRSRTSLFNILTHLKHHQTTTPPHHHNLAKHRIVLVLGPDASTCLLSCRLKENAERYTNYHENWTSVLGPDVSERVVIPRTRTSLFNILTHLKHHQTTTPPHHHNLAKHRIVLVLGPDASTCLLSCRLKGRDTTYQNIFVVSELLMRIITHHTSSTYTHRRVRDMSVKGSWYHGPEHLWYQRVVDENYHTSHILHIYTSQQHISTHHWAKTSPHHHKNTTTKTSPHHHITTILLGPDVDSTAPPRQRTSVLGPDGAEHRKVGKLSRKMNISSWDGAEHRKVRKLPRKMNISSWAGCCRTPTSTKITTKNEHQFLGRMLQNTDKYENYQETSTSVLGPDVAEHPKVRKLPGNIEFSSWAGCCSAKNVKKARVLL